jgi:tetratricopeptide (TPR) repeat protein
MRRQKELDLMTKYRLTLLCLLLGLMGGCATGGIQTEEQIDGISGEAHALNIVESRSMYLFSLARIHALDGDFDGALTLLQAAIEADPQSAFLHTSVAELYLKMNRPQEAINACRTAISIDPKHAEAHLLLANILSSLKQERGAIDHYKKVIELTPDKDDAYLQLAIAYLRIFEYEEAVKTLKALIAISSDSSLAYYYLGKAYDQMKLPKEALTYYRKVIELKPDFEPVFVDIGLALEAQGERPEAIKSFETLLQINPHNFSVMQHLVQLYIQENKLESALAILKVLIARDIGGLDTHRKAGLVYLELEQYDEAILEFEHILAQEPLANQVRFYLASAYEEKGEGVRAIEEFRKIPPTAYNYTESVGHIAYLYLDGGQGDKAVDLLKSAIAADPAKFDYYLHLAGIYEGLQRYHDALDVLLRVESKFATEARLHFRLGILYDKIGDKEQLISRMRRVLAITPADPQALNYLGFTYVEMGENLDEALKLLKEATALRPDDGFILDSLGWAYYKLKNYDDAVTYLKRAAKLVDDDPTILDHLGDAYLAVRDYANALATYKTLQKLEPGRKDLSEKLKKIRAESAEK